MRLRRTDVRIAYERRVEVGGDRPATRVVAAQVPLDRACILRQRMSLSGRV